MKYRQPRSPIVYSESDSSGEKSNDDQVEAIESMAISRVVSEILGRQPLEDSDASLFSKTPVIDTATVRTPNDEVDDRSESPIGFGEKEKPEELSKREKEMIRRKDVVSTANLTERKIKDILKYPCCDNLCLREAGRDEVLKHRTYYYGLTWSEKNVLLRGCMKPTPQGRTGYCVNGKSFCRSGFKKLYSVGNNRLQKVSQDIFC